MKLEFTHPWVARLLSKFTSVQSLSRVHLFAMSWTGAAYQASLCITNSQSLPKPMSIESVMPSNHLTLCHPLLLLPSIFPSIRVFSNESALHIRWPKYWSFSFNITPYNEYQPSLNFCCWSVPSFCEKMAQSNWSWVRRLTRYFSVQDRLSDIRQQSSLLQLGSAGGVCGSSLGWWAIPSPALG